MTRHSKSNNDGAVFTYHERRNIQHGTRHLRLPGAALKQWHHCAISLTTPTDPVVTPRGVLYDREPILKHLLRQKRERREGLAKQAVENTKRSRDDKMRRASEERAREAEAERRRDDVGVARSRMTETGDDDTAAVSSAGHNFWLPGSDVTRNAPMRTVPANAGGDADGEHRDRLYVIGGIAKLRSGDKASSSKTVCPIMQEPLRMRDLISVTLTRSPASTDSRKRGAPSVGRPSTTDDDDGDDSSAANKAPDDSDSDDDEDSNRLFALGGTDPSIRNDVRFICPVCRAPLTNSSKPVVLRTGTALCSRCVDQFVSIDACDPITSTPLDLKRDVIVIDNSGTAFAGSKPDDPSSKQASLYRPSVT